MSKKRKIEKKNWKSSFNLIGKPVINDFTYKLDEHSEKSAWVYNALNLGIYCGEKYGSIWAEMMGGYSENGENKIFCHGKDDDGNDDYKTQIIVDFEDRFNDNVLEQIGDTSFITVGLEKTNKGKTFYKKFLSAYDAIIYINEHLTEDMVVNVRGNLQYSIYNDNVQVRKKITNIALSKVDDPADYKATFAQSILIDKDSASFKNIDKDKGVMYIDTRVLDYVKEINGVEIKGQYPYNKTFEFAMDFSDEKNCKKIMDKLFKVKDGVTQINMEGDFIESGATVNTTWDDIPDEIKELVEMGIYKKEDALASCAARGSRERRMVLTHPLITPASEDTLPFVQKFEGQYEEEDLVFDLNNDDEPYTDDDEPPFDTDESSDSELSWLDAL